MNIFKINEFFTIEGWRVPLLTANVWGDGQIEVMQIYPNIYFQIMNFKEKNKYKSCDNPLKSIYDLYIIFCPGK